VFSEPKGSVEKGASCSGVEDFPFDLFWRKLFCLTNI
jgi:hypothetical protein